MEARNKITAPATPFPTTPQTLRTRAGRICLLLVVLVAAMVPWYTLRLLPLLAIGSAKINLLDGLVAAAVCLGLPDIVRGLKTGPRALWWVCAFIAAIVVPLLTGVHDPHARFLAIREVRALAFYALALVFATGGYRHVDFRSFAAAYVIGAAAASAAVFAHVQGLAPLPGYPDSVMPRSYHLGTPGFFVEYLDWTIPIIAFTLSLSAVLLASTRAGRLAAAVSLLAAIWYVVASAERFMQVVVVGVAGTLPPLLRASLPRLPADRNIRAAMALAAALILGAGIILSPAWLRGPIQTTALRWSHAPTDHSLQFRINEITGGFPRFLRHPLFGEGLGGLVLAEDPEHPGHPWPYIASSYGFLLIKTGLAGLALYLAIAAAALREAWRQRLAFPHDRAWPTPTVAMAGLGALLALNLLSPSVDTPEGAVSFSMFFGMIISEAGRTGNPNAASAAGGLRTVR